MREIYDYAVVGAGIAGMLTAALLGKEGNSIIVLEKNKRCGGYIYDMNGAPYGAHHIGIPDRKLLNRVLNTLEIDSDSHFKSADQVCIRAGGKEYHISLDLRQQKKQLITYFPKEEAGICKYIEYMQSFAKVLYAEDDSRIKLFFLQLVSKSYISFLQEYFINQELIHLLTFMGPCYGGVTGEDSAFTIASLVATYGNGSYYLDGTWFVSELERCLNGLQNVMIEHSYLVEEMNRNQEKDVYELTTKDGRKVYAKRVVFAGYFADILGKFCEKESIASKAVKKILDMKVGPSAYRLYFRVQKNLERGEYINLAGNHGDEIQNRNFILSTLDHADTNVMLTVITRDGEKTENIEAHMIDGIKRMIGEILNIESEKLEHVLTCSPEDRKTVTANPQGAVFGWQRSVSNNLNSNLIYSLQHYIKDVYVVGNWSATFGVFGVFYTVDKLHRRLKKEHTEVA